jgi:hypothetical protein
MVSERSALYKVHPSLSPTKAIDASPSPKPYRGHLYSKAYLDINRDELTPHPHTPSLKLTTKTALRHLPFSSHPHL